MGSTRVASNTDTRNLSCVPARKPEIPYNVLWDQWFRRNAGLNLVRLVFRGLTRWGPSGHYSGNPPTSSGVEQGSTPTKMGGFAQLAAVGLKLSYLTPQVPQLGDRAS